MDSRDVLAYPQDELECLDMGGTAHQIDAQALDFSDDAVILSFSTCMVPDPTGRSTNWRGFAPQWEESCCSSECHNRTERDRANRRPS